MAQVNGEYKTICDGLLDGYKGKVYGDDAVGTEHDDSCTMQKVIIKNGKVESATGELRMLDVIADLGETSKLPNEVQDTTDKNVGETTAGKNDTKLPQTGEKNNAFTGWLSTAIVLGIVWLGSMLLIEREKKKMAKR